MRRLAVPGVAAMLAACSQSVPGTGETGRDAPMRIDAAAIVRAYADDVDEADVAFAGHPLLISGDVVAVARNGRTLILTTGQAAERLPATIDSVPHPIAPHDLVTLRCERINHAGNRPSASGCTTTAIIPARIAEGG